MPPSSSSPPPSLSLFPQTLPLPPSRLTPSHTPTFLESVGAYYRSRESLAGAGVPGRGVSATGTSGRLGFKRFAPQVLVISCFGFSIYWFCFCLVFFTYLFIYFSIYSYICLYVYSFIYVMIYSCICLFVCSFILLGTRVDSIV